jgi:hypothetical protein
MSNEDRRRGRPSEGLRATPEHEGRPAEKVRFQRGTCRLDCQPDRGAKAIAKPAAEADLVRAISDDRRRLQRAARSESAIFAEAADKFAADPAKSTGEPLLDSAISDGETWLAEARNLSLLSLYENRIHPRCERNMAELRRPEAERRAAFEAASAEAALLEQAAEINGQTCDAPEPFTRRDFDFRLLESPA